MFGFRKKKMAAFPLLVEQHLQLSAYVEKRLQEESQKLVNDLLASGASRRGIARALRRPPSYVTGIERGSRSLSPREYSLVVKYGAK